MLHIIYKYLQQKNKNAIGIMMPKFRFVLLLVGREGEETKRGPQGTPMTSILDGFFKINLN